MELLEILSQSMERINMYDIDKMQYFESIKVKDLIDKIIEEVGDEAITLDGTTLYVANQPHKFKNLNSDLDIVNVINIVKDVANDLIEEYYFGNLKLLRKYILIKRIINSILQDYYFTKEDVKLKLKSEIPDIEFILGIVDNGPEFNSPYIITSITAEVLIETLKELGFEYDIEIGTLISGDVEMKKLIFKSSI